MKTLMTIFLVFILYNGMGQAKTFSLSGKVSDSLTGEILVKASVSLSGVKTKVKRLSLTDSLGNFMIDKLEEGDYLLVVSYVGFTFLNKQINLEGNEIMRIGLKKNGSSLTNVDILTQKKLISHTADKITINTAESAVSASDNLYNVLLKLPGMSELNGILYYQGRPANILLDGKSNNLSGDDLKDWLSAMLGTNTDKVEILLNPSSKYDAQGGVVINIKSLRNKNYGMTRLLTLGVGKGTYYKVPLGFSLNYRDSTINIYGGYDYNYTRQFFHLNALLSFNDIPSIVDMMDHNIRTQENHTARMGIDYDIDKKTTIGLLFRGAKNFRKRRIFDHSLSKSGTSNPDTVVTIDMLTDASFLIPALNLYFRRKISNKGSELIINADYWELTKKWNDDIAGYYHDLAGNPISSYNLNNNSPAKNSVKSITADLYFPIRNGNIETGLKFSESKTDNNILWERLINNEWKTDFSKTNHFIYDENVYAVYASALRKYGKWTMQAGFRLELTRSVGNSITLGMVTERRFEDLFPSLSIQYRPSVKHALALTYKKSIKRFGFDIINPFINLQGQYSYHKGNPYIRPSYFNNLEVNWSYKNNLVVSGNLSLVEDPISYAYEKGPDNTSHGSFLNFNSGRLFNFSLTYTTKLFKGKWNSTNVAIFSHSQMPDFDSHMQYYNSYSLTSINTIALPLKFMLEFSGFYNSPLLNGTVWQSNNYGVSGGIAKPIIKSKGSLKLSCTDIFDTQILHYKTKGKGINITSDWKVESRFINLLFTYRFGNLNVKQNKNRKTGIEDEKSRMGVN